MTNLPCRVLSLLLLSLVAACSGGGGGGVPPPGTGSLPPIATTQAATDVTTSVAVLNGSVNPNGTATDVWFDYGPDSGLSHALQSPRQAIGNGVAAVSVNFTASGFTAGTTYYFRICASSTVGIANGTIMNCTTGSPGFAPTVQTLAATGVAADNARLSGSVNPNGLATTAYFEWGPDSQLVGATATSGQSIGSGYSSVAVNAALTGLTGNTTYHYRVVGTNSSGTSRGLIGSFTTAANGLPPLGNTVNVLYLTHSTGQVIWNGGVPQALASYNSSHATQYSITQQAYPAAPYPWDNYPYDYWNLWVAHTGASMDQNQANLDMLVGDYDVIVFKHCFPVSAIEPDVGPASVSSSTKSLQNYYLQYGALKARMRGFPGKRFIVWTGAALRVEDTTPEQATRAKTFFDWVRNEWDERGDNVFIWDFYALETEGGLYLTPANASSIDSHPDATFAQRVAPLFVNRLVDVIEGRGDTGDVTGQ